MAGDAVEFMHNLRFIVRPLTTQVVTTISTAAHTPLRLGGDHAAAPILLEERRFTLTDPDASTVFWIDPAEELVGVLMVQLTSSSLKLREKFSAIVYSAIVD